jgi:hypothetical protein
MGRGTYTVVPASYGQIVGLARERQRRNGVGRRIRDLNVLVGARRRGGRDGCRVGAGEEGHDR